MNPQVRIKTFDNQDVCCEALITRKNSFLLRQRVRCPEGLSVRTDDCSRVWIWFCLDRKLLIGAQMLENVTVNKGNDQIITADL